MRDRVERKFVAGTRRDTAAKRYKEHFEMVLEVLVGVLVGGVGRHVLGRRGESARNDPSKPPSCSEHWTLVTQEMALEDSDEGVVSVLDRHLAEGARFSDWEKVQIAALLSTDKGREAARRLFKECATRDAEKNLEQCAAPDRSVVGDRCRGVADLRCKGRNCTEHCQKHCGGTCLRSWSAA